MRLSWFIPLAILICASVPAKGQDLVVLGNGQSLRGIVGQVRNEYITFLPSGESMELRLMADTIDQVIKHNFDNNSVLNYSTRMIDKGDGQAIPTLLQLTLDGRIKEFMLIETNQNALVLDAYLVKRFFLEKDSQNLVFIGVSGTLSGTPPEPLTARYITHKVADLISDQQDLVERYRNDSNAMRLKVIRRYIKAYNKSNLVTVR